MLSRWIFQTTVNWYPEVYLQNVQVLCFPKIDLYIYYLYSLFQAQRGDAILTLPNLNTTEYDKISRGQVMEGTIKGYRLISSYKLFKKSIPKADLASHCDYKFNPN